MRGTQIALVAVCLLAVILLFAYGNIKTPAKEALENAGMPSGEVTTEVKPEVLEEIWLSRLSPERRDTAIQLKEGLSSLKKSAQVQKLGILKEKWENWGNLEASAYYAGLETRNNPSPANYVSSGERIFVASRIARGDSLSEPFLLDYGISLLSEGSEKYPEDPDIKILLSRFFVDGKGAVMQGVGLLRQVTAKDSAHVEANLLLGKLGIVSGQFDKAASRMEMILSREPENPEAWYYLGEAKVGLNDKSGATKAFKECLNLSKEPAFRKELENYIREINKQ